MPGLIVIAEVAAALATAVAMTVEKPFSSSAPRSPASLFGGPVSIHARAGRIEIDLERSGPLGLRRVACTVATLGTTCFVSLPRP